MKRIHLAVGALALLATAVALPSCTASRTDLVIRGVLKPDVGCSFKASEAGPFLFALEYFVVSQDQALGELSAIFAFQTKNNIGVANQGAPAGGGSLTSDTQWDVVIRSADVEMFDDNGTSIATETVPATGYVPGRGGSDAVTLDLMGKTIATALRKRNANFTAHFRVILKGRQVGNGDIESEPFEFSMNMRYEQLPTLGDGGLIAGADGGFVGEDRIQLCY